MASVQSSVLETGKPAYDRYVAPAADSASARQRLLEFFGRSALHYEKSTLHVLKAALRKGLRLTLVSDPGLFAQRPAFEFAFEEMKIGERSQAIEHAVILSEDEIRRLALGSTPRIACVILALAATGVRISELLNIKLSDCSGDGRFVTMKIKGKGDFDRSVFLPALQVGHIQRVFRGKVYLFESLNGTPLKSRYVWREISRAGRRLLKRRVTPHCFRHTFATRELSQNRRSIKAISRYLGHRNTSTTLRFYVHDSLTAEELFPDSFRNEQV